MVVKENGWIMAADSGGPLSDKKLYIFGLKDLQLVRDIAFTVSPLGLQSGAIIAWGGDQPPTFNLVWTSTAGFEHVALRTRDTLLDQVKLAQAMGASADILADKTLKGPTKIRLVIPGHINCIGALKRISTTEQGPWATTGPASGAATVDSNRLPTSCEFQLEFLPMSQYSETLITDTTGSSNGKVETWLAATVYSKFYQQQ